MQNLEGCSSKQVQLNSSQQMMLKPLSPGLGGTDSVSLILQVGEIVASNEGRGQVLVSGVSLSPVTPLWYLCWNSSPSLLQYPGQLC